MTYFVFCDRYSLYDECFASFFYGIAPFSVPCFELTVDSYADRQGDPLRLLPSVENLDGISNRPVVVLIESMKPLFSAVLFEPQSGLSAVFGQVPQTLMAHAEPLGILYAIIADINLLREGFPGTSDSHFLLKETPDSSQRVGWVTGFSFARFRVCRRKL